MTFRTLVRVVFIALVFAIASMAHAAGSVAQTHYTLLEEPRQPFPRKFVVLPTNIEVMEMSAGGVVEKAEAYTAQAKLNVDTALVEQARASGKFELIDLPSLSSDERQAVEEHLALYDVVARESVAYARMGGAWADKAKHFDYSIGPGLGFLRNKTGADAAIIMTGRDVMSTSGRKAAFVMAAVLGVAIQMGSSYMTAGVVDLETGDLQWVNLSAGQKDFINVSESGALVGDLLSPYPGPEIAASASPLAKQ